MRDKAILTVANVKTKYLIKEPGEAATASDVFEAFRICFLGVSFNEDQWNKEIAREYREIYPGTRKPKLIRKRK